MTINSNQRNVAVAAAAAAIVAEDRELKDQLSGLIRDIVKHQRIVMRAGSSAEKAALVKAILPQMLNAMNTVSQNEQEATERAAYERMQAVMRGDIALEDTSPNLKVV